MEQEIALLRSILRQSRRSIRSITSVERHLQDISLRSCLQLQREAYESIANDASRFLRERGRAVPAFWNGFRFPGGFPPALIDRRRRNSAAGLHSALNSVGQMQIVDPKVAALNRRLLMVCRADAEQMNLL